LAATALGLAAAAAAPAASGNETSPARLRQLLVAADFDEASKLAQPAARCPDQANGSEGFIQTNTPILLDWGLCVNRGGTNAATAPRPHISRYPWLEFIPASDGLAARVHLQVDSFPWTAWKLRLQQVDRFGSFVVVHHKREQVIEKSFIGNLGTKRNGESAWGRKSPQRLPERSSFNSLHIIMNNKSIGAILLSAAGVVTAIASVGAQIANAIVLGLFKAGGHGGIVPAGPDEASLHWSVIVAILTLTAAGSVFLFRRGKSQSC